MSSRAMDSTGQLVAVIVEKSQPDPKRRVPRGATEDELRDLDRRSAQCYADLEVKAHRLRKLATSISKTDPVDDVTPVEVVEDEDSLVHHIGSVRSALEK